MENQVIILPDIGIESGQLFRSFVARFMPWPSN